MGKIKNTDFFSLIHDFFKIYLPSQRKSSPHTIRAYQKALDGLLDYTAAQKNISLGNLSFECIDYAILSGFLDSIEKKGLRDQFLLLLLYDTAARVQEIVDLKVCDIRRGKAPTVLLHGKGSKIRTVPLMKKTMGHFENYVKIFHPNENEYSEDPLFYSIARKNLSALDESSVRKLVYTYGNAAKKICPEMPETIHPHMLRHSRAMHLYQHGMDLTLISQWLGHAQLETTLIYAHADTEQKRKAIEQATPMDSPLKNRLNSEKYQVTDDEVLKRLYGLK